jgi:uridine phosphorylase
MAHLHPTAELAERALLPDDPGQALALTRVLFGDTPRMFNHHRGLWGYTGVALDGAPLTVQSTGIGGTSAAVVLGELHALGLRRAVRIGRAWALDGSLRAGELIAATAVLAGDGASRALGAGDRLVPRADRRPERRP